jgi:hypothetical protein
MADTVSMAPTTVRALAPALLFAALSRRPPADGGPYACARAAFGHRGLPGSPRSSRLEGR